MFLAREGDDAQRASSQATDILYERLPFGTLRGCKKKVQMDGMVLDMSDSRPNVQRRNRPQSMWWLLSRHWLAFGLPSAFHPSPFPCGWSSLSFLVPPPHSPSLAGGFPWRGLVGSMCAAPAARLTQSRAVHWVLLWNRDFILGNFLSRTAIKQILNK